jgi:glycosyltransferase involved in cell wall biosynthesis
MKVSVIIPAHNEEKFIGETLKAVLKQDYPDFEVIVVDNASSDKTSEVVSTFRNVTLVYESRKGLLWAREAGRKQATGDIIVSTDADCLPHPEWLSDGIKHFTADHIVAVTGPCDFHDGGALFRNGTLIFQKTVYPFFNRMFQEFRFGAVLIGGNNFVRASALKAIGGYNTSIPFYGEDTDTAKRLSKHGTLLFKRDVITKTSSRRFVQEGTWETLTKYIFNFFWVTFFKTPHRKLKFHTKAFFSRVK